MNCQTLFSDKKTKQKKKKKKNITKTCLYNFDPIKPHFYKVKLGFTGVYIIFLISAQNRKLWVLVRTAFAKEVLTSNHNLCFEQKYENNQSFLSEYFQFLEVKFSICLNRRVFVMKNKKYISCMSYAEFAQRVVNVKQNFSNNESYFFTTSTDVFIFLCVFATY